MTALTVHALSSITLQRYSDPGLLKSALTWMHGQQNEDGSFDDVIANSTSLNKRIGTTAFVLTCLSDVQHDDIVCNYICKLWRGEGGLINFISETGPVPIEFCRPKVLGKGIDSR